MASRATAILLYVLIEFQMNLDRFCIELELHDMDAYFHDLIGQAAITICHCDNMPPKSQQNCAPLGAQQTCGAHICQPG